MESIFLILVLLYVYRNRGEDVSISTVCEEANGNLKKSKILL